MLNKAIIMGRMTRDPEVKQTQGGVSVCSFTVAVDRDIADKSTGKKETDFINVTAWRGTADLVGKYFCKGRAIIVEGRIQVRSWTDKDDNKRTATEIVANNVYFGDSKKKDDGSTGDPPVPANASQSDHVEMGTSEDDLPF